MSFIDVTQNTYRPIATFINFAIFFEIRFHILTHWEKRNLIIRLEVMMYEKSYNIFIFFDFLKGMSFVSFGSNFSSFFNVRSKDVYSERKFELSIVDILLLIAFKPG